MGEKISTFKTIVDIEEYFSETGFNDVKYLFALGKENIYYMLYQKHITIEEFENTEMEPEINICINKTLT